MSTLKTETVAGSPRNDALESAVEVTRAVRELLATIDKQAEELQRLRSGVFHYADVGGVPIYETLEGRESRHKSEVERLNGLLSQGAEKINELKQQKDALHERLSWYEKYRTEPTGQLEVTRIRAENAERACETMRIKFEGERILRVKAEEEVASLRVIFNDADTESRTLRVERVGLKDKIAELEQDLSIVRGDLASVTLERDKAQEVISRKGWSVFQFSSSGEFERIARAERKAAAANKANDELRKHASVLRAAYVNGLTSAPGCDCDTCKPINDALAYLDSKKANG